MTRERRLGRGLEALLGQLPGWTGPGAPSRPGTPPGTTAEPTTPATPPPQGDPRPTLPAGLGEPFRGSAVMPQPSPSIAAMQPQPVGTPVVEPTPAATLGPKKLPVDRIEHNPHQPRQDFDPDDIRRLAESLAAHGLLQPVVVRRTATGYQLVAGERRLRAAKQAGWTEVPVTMVEADDRQMAELAIIENLQRKDLSALEKAASFQRYLEQYQCTQEELAGRLKIDRSTVANLIRLLELPEPVQEALRRGKITPGHARALLPLGEEREQIAFCDRIQKEGMSVRQTEEVVQEAVAVAEQGPLGIVGRDGSKSRARRGQAEHQAALEQEFRAALGLRVRISYGKNGRGKLVVQFADHEEFERLRQHICDPAQPRAQVG